MSRPTLLDAFCGAGGASVGYARAGFEVHGVDHIPQPRYPYPMAVADALEYIGEHGHNYDVIAASPPCQAYSVLAFHSRAQRTAPERGYPELIAPIREALIETGRPYVIENVPGAPLSSPLLLCGSMFGNDMLRRHRLFESNVLLFGAYCDHSIHTPRFPPLRSDRKGKLASVVGVFGYGGGSAKHKHLWEQAMGIGWMSKKELAQAIPPAYTEFLGSQIYDMLVNEREREAG